jgi:hypothetical protein
LKFEFRSSHLSTLRVKFLVIDKNKYINILFPQNNFILTPITIINKIDILSINN